MIWVRSSVIELENDFLLDESIPKKSNLIQLKLAELQQIGAQKLFLHRFNANLETIHDGMNRKIILINYAKRKSPRQIVSSAPDFSIKKDVLSLLPLSQNICIPLLNQMFYSSTIKLEWRKRFPIKKGFHRKARIFNLPPTINMLSSFW